MISRVLCCTAIILISIKPTVADPVALTESGTFLGRITTEVADLPLRVTVDLNGDAPVATYAMARFQNNTPQHRLPSGEWISWTENRTDLIDNELQANGDGTLTFDLIDEDFSVHFLPVVITIAYSVEGDSLKSGYLVID